MQLIIRNNLPLHDLLSKILAAAKTGLEPFLLTDTLRYPPDYRLAFRELGPSLGLRAIEKMQLMIDKYRDTLSKRESLSSQLASFEQYLHLKQRIENFWLGALPHSSPLIS